MNTRFEIGNFFGSRPAFSRFSRMIGTLRANSALLEPPDPIHASAIVAARRSASGWPPPSQIGGGGPCPGLGGPPPPPPRLVVAPVAPLRLRPHPLVNPSAPPEPPP